jgi:archaemetzincin
MKLKLFTAACLSTLCLSLFFHAGCRQSVNPVEQKTKAQKQAAGLGKPEIAPLLDAMEAIKPLHTLMGEPLPGDWLETQPEAGQTFVEYLKSDPVTPQGNRRILYIQPLGQFTETERRIVNLTADYMGRFFNLPVKILDDMPLSIIPAGERRQTPVNVQIYSRRKRRAEQILTGYVLNTVLRPRLPDDATALIAFTTSDLWPGENWNYLFGQASLRDRVGVWSIHRLGEPEASEEDYALSLLRTMKLATHETGHMFSMQHCTKYECNMSGTNHLGETDRRPLDVCPECMAKVCWATKTDPHARYEKLAEFCQAQGLTAEKKFFEDSIKALKEYKAL